MKTKSTGPNPENFRFSKTGLGEDNLLSNKFPGDVDAAGPGTTV